MSTIGVQVSKQQVDAIANNLYTGIATAMLDAQQFYSWLSAQTDAQLQALGYALADIPVFRSAAADANTLAQVFFGRQALAAPQDFSTFMKQLWGIVL